MQARACKCQSDKEEASQRFQLLQNMGPAPKRIAVLSIATFRSILTSPDLRDARCQPRLSIEKAQNAGHVRRRCQHKPVQACQPVRRPMSKQHGWRRGTAAAGAAVARLWVRRGGGHERKPATAQGHAGRHAFADCRCGISGVGALHGVIKGSRSLRRLDACRGVYVHGP